MDIRMDMFKPLFLATGMPRYGSLCQGDQILKAKKWDTFTNDV
jgi:hypothetical protein